MTRVPYWVGCGLPVLARLRLESGRCVAAPKSYAPPYARAKTAYWSHRHHRYHSGACLLWPADGPGASDHDWLDWPLMVEYARAAFGRRQELADDPSFADELAFPKVDPIRGGQRLHSLSTRQEYKANLSPVARHHLAIQEWIAIPALRKAPVLTARTTPADTDWLRLPPIPLGIKVEVNNHIRFAFG